MVAPVVFLHHVAPLLWLPVVIALAATYSVYAAGRVSGTAALLTWLVVIASLPLFGLAFL
jgi:hypothetical protein